MEFPSTNIRKIIPKMVFGIVQKRREVNLGLFAVKANV